MRRKILSTLVFGSLMLVSWGQAEAAEGNQIYQLNPVVVTATRLKENAAEVPASVSVITADQIKQKNVRTITEAINYLPGIYSDRPQGMSDNAGGISIRGFGESNILVLYDGMPLNNGFSGGVNWSTISIDDVAKIELVRGAGSSLYGGRAVGGVINIVSKNPDKNSGKIYTEYGSHDTWRRGVNITRKLTDKWSLSAGYENRRTDGYRKKLSYTKKGATKTPTGTVGTGYEESKNHAGDTIYILGNPGTTASKDNTYNFKLRYNFSDTKSMMYQYTHDYFKYYSKDPVSYIHDADGNELFNGSVLLPDGKYYNFSEADFTDYYGKKKTDIHSFTYKDDANQILFSAGLVNSKDDGYSTGSDLAGEGPGSRNHYPNKSSKADFQKTWDIGKNTLVSGFDIQRDSMTYNQSKLAHWHNWGSITKDVVTQGGKNLISSVFVQDKYKFNDNWNAYAGLRLDHYKKYGGFFRGTKDGQYLDITRDTKTYNELSPKFSLEYLPNSSTTYYISYGHSFNAPTLYKLYRFDGRYIGNPSLKPEKTDTIEAGIKKSFKKTQINFDVYHAKTKDLITTERAGKYNTFINKEKAKRTGFEMEVRQKFNDSLSAYANYAYERATDDEGERIYSIPRHIFHAGLNYQKPLWDAYVEAQYVSDRNEKGDIPHHLYSYDAIYTINLGANYKFAKGATIGLAIDNLLDKDYWSWYYCGAGRTYTVKLSYEF